MALVECDLAACILFSSGLSHDVRLTAPEGQVQSTTVGAS